MGPVLAQFTPHVSNFLQICPSELCKIGISVHFRDVSVAQGCLRRVQEGKSRFKFNQVSPDDSLEWLDRIGIRSGRIVDMTNTSSALTRWALSYNLRSRIAEHTHTMFRLHQETSSHSTNLISEREIVTTKMNDHDHCSSFSRGSRYFHHQNIKFVFISLPQKISSPVKFKSRC